MPLGVIQAESSTLVVVDIQERLLPHIAEKEQVVAGSRRLIQAAKELEIPRLLTEQYPRGLGKTVPEIKEHTDDLEVLEKTAFSCMQAENFIQALHATGSNTLVLCGVESHVCVLQTALDALAAGKRVVVVADAVRSRSLENHHLALERVRRSGGQIVSSEMVLMEWLRDAKHPAFKAVQKLIK